MPPEQSIEHFREHGWMRVPAAFGSSDAAAMLDAVWQVLAQSGIDRDRRETWTVERPAHLQRLRRHPAFQAVGGAPVRAAIDALLCGRAYETPPDWGALFVAFPGEAEWGVPAAGWHIDAHYAGPLWPTGGVKTHALLGDIGPRGGGTLIVGGSHRLVHQWFQDHPPPEGARSRDLRALLLSHPYIRDLHDPADPQGRIARFMGRIEEVDGIALQVVENIGRAGDVLLLHPLVLHVAAPNVASEPRFLLSGGVTTDMWGWA